MNKFRTVIVVHWLVITKVVLYSIVSLGMSWQLATEGKDLHTLDFWQWINITVGIVVIWGNNIMSFIDKTVARISEGKKPFETGQTAFFTKEDLGKQKENG